MRILHTGDLHLDGAFCAYGSSDAEARRESGRELLKNIFKTAKEKQCDMMLISGDLFDSRFVSDRTGKLFCSLVKDCGIPVVIAPGNHDSYGEDSFYAKASRVLGDKLTLFTSNELQMFEFDSLNVRVFGYAFTSQNLPNDPLLDAIIPAKNGYTYLLCAHADLSSALSRKAPLTLESIKRCGFDYAALGHIHRPNEFEDEKGRVRYCGFAEGRGFDEIGEGGVLIVDIDDDSCKAEKVILSARAYFILNATPKSEELFSELSSLIKSKKYTQNTNLRLILEGEVGEELTRSEIALLTEQLTKECELEYLEIFDRRMPSLDAEYLGRDATLRGELYRALSSGLSSPDKGERLMAQRALRIGLAAIDGKPIENNCD